MEHKNSKTDELSVPFSANFVVMIAASFIAFKTNEAGASSLMTGVYWISSFVGLRFVYQIILAFVSGAIEGVKEAVQEAKKRDDK
jgi:hypothetical protein